MKNEKKYVKRLGLDLGTNSIGWCLLDWNKEATEYDLVDLGVRRWKNNATKADRSKYRLARRQRKHLESRLKRLKTLLDQAGLPPCPTTERGKNCPFSLRVKALDYALAPKELREILFHIAKNRGFKGSEAEMEKQEKEQKGFKKALSETEKNVYEHARTYSEWLLKTEQPKLRLRGGSDQKPQHYPTRKLIKAEFEAIRRKQEPSTPRLNWNELEDILFFQREIHAPYIGKCSIYSSEERMPKNNPLALEYVVLEKLSHITLCSKITGELRVLTHEEIRQAQECLKNQKIMTYSSLLKHLKLQKDYTIKRKEGEEEKIPGLMTTPTGYLNLSCKAVEEIIKRFWNSEERVGAIVAELRKQQTKEMVRSDHLKYYGEIMRDTPNFYIIPACRCTNSDACSHQIGEDERKWGITPNSIHHAAFNQLRHLINAIIEKYGAIDEIVIELVRDEWDPPKNQTIRKQNEKRNQEIRERLKEASRTINKENTLKGQLFVELEKDCNMSISCPYCGQSLSWESIFSSDIQIEHVIPYCYTKSNAFSYLMLAHRDCNAKKGDKTPYEAFGKQPDYDQMIQRVPERKRWMFKSDALERFKELTDGWLPSSLVNTSSIAKHARTYLFPITKNVWATRGSLTADLRRHFKLGKNRDQDHRHHAVDAFCIALISPSLLQKISRYDWTQTHFQNSLFSNEHGLIQQVKDKLEKIVVSQRLDHALHGAIVKETAYGIYPDTPEKRYRQTPNAKKKGERETISADAKDMVEIDGKGYKSAEYAYADLWQNQDNPKEVIWEFKTLRDALDIQAGRKSYCQPADREGRWRKIIRVRKGDYLQDSQQELVFRVIQFNPAGNRIFLGDPKEVDPERRGSEKSYCVATSFFKAGWHFAHVDILGHVKATAPRRCI